MNTEIKRILVAALLGFFMVACGVDEPEATPTLSSDQVLLTAQAIAQLTREAEGPPPELPTFAPTDTATPDISPTPEATATISTPRVQANYNANVRNGPDEGFTAISFLLENQQADVLGQYANPVNGPWYFMNREGIEGWIWGGAVTFLGNPNVVPALTPPPTLTPEPGSPTPTETPSQTPAP